MLQASKFEEFTSVYVKIIKLRKNWQEKKKLKKENLVENRLLLPPGANPCHLHSKVPKIVEENQKFSKTITIVKWLQNHLRFKFFWSKTGCLKSFEQQKELEHL